ncbi:hypothetical protein HK096_005810, partial [Nowakowskiella sp. JEL0078]
MPESPSRLKKPSKLREFGQIKLPSHLSPHISSVPPQAAEELFKVHTTASAKLKRKAEDEASAHDSDDAISAPPVKPPVSKRQRVVAAEPKPAAVKPVTRASSRSTATAARAAGPTRSTAATASKAKPLQKAAAKTGSKTNPKSGQAGPQKRAAYDYKGRLEDLEEEKQRREREAEILKEQKALAEKHFEETQKQNEELSKIRMALQNTVQVKEKEKSNIGHELEGLRDELYSTKRKHEDELGSLQQKFKTTVNNLEDQLHSSQRQNERLNSEVDVMTKENSTLK